MSFGSKFITTLTIALFAGLPLNAGVQLPGNKTVQKVDFERHVMGLFGRTGCNSGSCHGSFQGKGGLRLSLFGFDPDKDYWMVTHDHLGRRIDPNRPENSLLLLKATGHVDHGGSVRFARDSWQYKIFREWIADGAQWTKGSGEVKRVEIIPDLVAFKKPGESFQVTVKAHFTDGSAEDITPFCDFRTNDDAVAEVTSLGLVTSVKPGSTHIAVSYRGNVSPVRILVPNESKPGFVYPKLPEHNYIDTEIFSRLKLLNMVPSDLTTDEEFLRRVYIDTIAQLPTPDEVRAFLKSTDPNKREKKIDELLAHPLHAALWATKFCDITGNDTAALENPAPIKPRRSQAWHDWFSKRIRENMPYDQIVRGVLVATSREGKSPEEWLKQVDAIDKQLADGFVTDYANRDTLDLYWRRQQNVPPELWGERTAAAFMGVRLECAQCHKHPFDRWTQVEYRQYANVFGSLAFGVSPTAKKIVDAANAKRKEGLKNNQVNLIKEIYVSNAAKLMTHPDTGVTLGAKLPAGPELEFKAGKDLREDLWNWLVQPDNPFFARSFVNRVWGHYFGIGIVHPVDDFSIGNPPSNEQLLNKLAKDFLDSKFNIRHIEKQILMSRTYQLSARPNETNKFDKNNFARGYIRPMMAEAVIDVLNSALGAEEKFGNDAKPGAKAVEVGSSQIQNAQLAYAFRIFGRPPRTTACDCERSAEPALPQKLFLMTDQGLINKLRDPKARLMQLVNSKKSDDEVLEELFLATLTRVPTAEEREKFKKYRETVPGRQEAFTDALYALINTREFILNH
jgi:hypothetical protein